MSKLDNPWQAFTLVSLIGADLAICVVSGFLLGRYIDGKLDTAPLFLMIGLISGLGLGVYSVYRIVRKYL